MTDPEVFGIECAVAAKNKGTNAVAPCKIKRAEQRRQRNRESAQVSRSRKAREFIELKEKASENIFAVNVYSMAKRSKSMS